MPTVGIVVALPEEARTLVSKRLRFGETHPLSGGHWLIVSGAGPDRATEAAERLIEKGIRGLMSWGCAGALIADAAPGDLLISHEIRTVEGELIQARSEWAERLSASLKGRILHHRRRIQESHEIIAKTAQKSALGLAGGGHAVDMESAAILRCALRRNLDFVAIRAIADHLEMPLPNPVMKALNPRGDVRMPRLLGELARSPRSLPDLIRLGQAFSKAASTLKAVRTHTAPDFSF